MIPYKIDEPLHRVPVATAILILICTFVFFRQITSASPTGLVPLDFIYTLFHPGNGLAASGSILIISFFLHGGLMHLIGNMWYLWLFGSALENHIGSFRFVLLYLLFGIVAMLTQVANDPLSTVPIVGASGAIAGIMGMYLILKPFSKIIFWFPPVFSFRFYSFLFLLFWFWMQWHNIGAAKQQGSLVAWWAHIGGFICGMLYACWVRMSKQKLETPNLRAKKRR